MTDDRSGPWTEVARGRWQRIRDHAFEDARAPLDFTAKLAREQGWSRGEARAAIEEYRRFCFLATQSGEAVVPGVEVDEVWHLHLIYSEDYWQRFCPEVLGFAFHHHPGGLAHGDATHYRRRYAETLADYEHWFGPPPERWWPATSERFCAPQRYCRVDRARVWLIPKPRLQPHAWFAAMFGLIGCAVAFRGEAMPLDPLEWRGPEFLVLFLVLAIASLIIAAVWRRLAIDNGRTEAMHGLDASAVAMLAGGEARVVERVIGELLTRGAAQFDATQQRLVVTEVPRDLDDAARDLAEALRRDGDIRSLAMRCRATFTQLARHLEQRGLWLDGETAARIARRSALAPAVVLALGVAKVVVGVSRDRPVAILVILCVLLAIITLVFAFKLPQRSRSGDRALLELKRRHARAMRAPRDQEWPIALALVGSSVLAGTAYAAFHETRHPAASNSSSDSSSSDSSSDSGGDSGGSDSGGGCGGCGGGGD